MKAEALIQALHKKLKTKTVAQLARALGVSSQTLFNWRDREIITPRNVASLISKARAASAKETQQGAVKPIVEFYPIDRTLTTQECSYLLFDTTKNGSLYEKQLKSYLDQSRGLYIFYDSQGRALYVGRAVETSLWHEINLAFNRERQVQKITLVAHPEGNREFKPSHEKLRQPRATQVELCDMAYFFSAYEVARGMIDDLEALLVRGFANDILNVKMEKFAATKQ